MKNYQKRPEDLLSDDSFIRWVEGKASESELSRWRNWLQDDPARKDLVKEAKSIHFGFRFQGKGAPDVERQLSKLTRSVDEYEFHRRKHLYSRPVQFYRAAAVIVLLLSVLSVLYLSYADKETQEPAAPRMSTTHTEYGHHKVLTLYDGSTITLNANSSLKYPSTSTGGDMEVWLEGEAYFDIVHKTGAESRSFLVHTSDGRVEVLGTRFNVNTFGQGTEVILEQGKVSVEVIDSLNQTKAGYLMEPGELSRFESAAATIHTQKIQTELYTSWTQNRLIFDRSPLSQVGSRIEQIYGVKLYVKDPELKGILVSGSVPNNNLEVLLNGLGKMLNRSISVKDGAVHVGSEPYTEE